VTILLSALFAGVVAIFVTLSIERLGGRTGGIVGTLPSTIVPAAYGLFEASESADDFAMALSATPVAMILNALFLLAWREVPDRLPTHDRRVRFVATLSISLGAWSVFAVVFTVGLRQLFASGATPLFIAVVATCVIFVLGLLATRKTLHAPVGTNRIAPVVILARGGMAAVAIGSAVLFAQHGAPIVAGVAAVFPAIFLTTMVALWLSQGEAVPRGAVGPMMLGSTSVAAYAVFALVLFPRLGPLVGTLVSWMLSALLVTVPLQRLLRRDAA
jgi:hypothetical protein